jgi:hypothetical protein
LYFAGFARAFNGAYRFANPKRYMLFDSVEVFYFRGQSGVNCGAFDISVYTWGGSYLYAER